MTFSICMRAGLFSCMLTLTVLAPSVFSKTGSSYSDEDIHQLADIVISALEINPEIQAAKAAMEATRARLAGAGLPLNNPELELEAERTDINTYTLGISQTVDWHDKKSAFEQVARAELTSAQVRVEALRLEKASELLDALGRIATHNEITTFSKHRTEILERFAKLAERRYTAGDIPQSELELARLSLAEAVMQHAGNGSELIQARSDFFSLSGQSLKSSIKFPDQLPTTLPSTQDEATLARNHPQVQTAYQMAQVARQKIRASDQERKADPRFGLTGGREDQENLVALSFSIPLQVRNSFRSNVDATQAEALQAEQEAQQAYLSVLARLKGAQERYKLVARAWSLWLSQGQPSLHQRIELLEAQWQAGEMSTTDYLLQIQQTLDTQIAGVELHGNLWSAWVEWLSASGNLNKWLNETSEEQ
ncbi:MAG: TolC family protein [Candidatus Thiodiazotropha sp.]